MMNDVKGMAIDLVEKAVNAWRDPQTTPASRIAPAYEVSPYVSVSRDKRGLYTYHVSDSELQHAGSFGNSSAWMETNGGGSLLGLYSIEAEQRLIGGMAVNYLLPFRDLAPNAQYSSPDESEFPQYIRSTPAGNGSVHLNPAFQQRQFTIGDGLEVLETIYLPRTDGDDPPVAYTVCTLTNHTAHPLSITLIASADLRGDTEIDVEAEWDDDHHILLAHNQSHPQWVRFFGADSRPDHHLAAVAKDDACSTTEPLADRTDERGDLVGSLQFQLIILPGQHRSIRLLAGFSCSGKDEARQRFHDARRDSDALSDTLAYCESLHRTANLEMPDDLLTQAVQWAKICLARPLANYQIGQAFTNDPGQSSHIVGRDAAWYVHGCDFVLPNASCDLLTMFADRQRDDGLIVEWIDGNSGEIEDHNFNINDNTPLFVIAAAHHIKTSDHDDCRKKLFEPMKRAADLILNQRDERGLVVCTADGIGAKGICGWRNALQNKRISGAVTEINAECYAALRAMSDMCDHMGDSGGTERYAQAAGDLKQAINTHLVHKQTNLYVRNIDLQGQTATLATSDMVFPLMFGVSDPRRSEAVTARLLSPEFMTEAGIRVLPEVSPQYDPAGASGLLGGVWSGATWWFAMGSRHTHPAFMSKALRSSYQHLIRNPKTFNVVPGQFNEWFDGRTLVNRGMRLSPWAPPRYLWAAIEGLAGVDIGFDHVKVNPLLPPQWLWLSMHDLPCKDHSLSFIAYRAQDQLRLFCSRQVDSEHPVEVWDEQLADSLESLTTGVSCSAFRIGDAAYIFCASTRGERLVAPILAHHVIKTHHDYDVQCLNSLSADWQSLGVCSGKRLQRIAVRLEARGYAIYRIQRAE